MDTEYTLPDPEIVVKPKIISGLGYKEIPSICENCGESTEDTSCTEDRCEVL